ncbi:hypothetical protein Y1Q_0022925 [Alligator mississippiensis]|uniref:Uncharacterized protein n=1 Tax=Alligator mississippiensis TaxID=8496 RepID=A0A151MHV9_ALLMI|nr:hypothetical protein Y1Q_0022925 [Alligator mississippiensis]
MASPNWDSGYDSFENAILNGITSLVSVFSYLSSSKLDARELEKIKKEINSAFEEVNLENKKANAQEEELISQIEKLSTKKEGTEHAKRVKEKERDKLSKMLEYYKKDEQKKTEKKNTLEEKVEAAEDTNKKKRMHHTILKHVYLMFLFLYILFVLLDMFQMPFKEIFGKLHSITIFITGIIWYFLNDMENKLLVSREVIYEHSTTVNYLEKAVSKLEKKKKETEETLEGIEMEIENLPNISACERKIHELNEEKKRTTNHSVEWSSVDNEGEEVEVRKKPTCLIHHLLSPRPKNILDLASLF